MKRTTLAIALALLTACYLTQFTVATATRKVESTKFTVRVENISNPEGMTASNGQKFPFALSPGMFVLSEKNAAIFTEGKPARQNGLEMQAEDGDPSGLVASFVAMHHSSNLHGVFNTPLGAMAAGPIRPGDSYEFTVTATTGMKLFMTQMFGQSNDWFYAPGPGGIALFDAKGNPIGGDVTDQFYLWDAGTEKDEEIGIGPNQGPRQKGPNTGATEHGVVHRVEDGRWVGKNSQLFRITINASSFARAQTVEKKLDHHATQLPSKPFLTLDAAKKIAAVAELEAKKRGATVVIAVVDDGGWLLVLERLDDTQVASVDVGIAKAKTAAIFRRPSRVFEEQVKNGRIAALALPGAVALQGGVPIILDGKVIGAIGVSGNSPQEDEDIAKIGADSVIAAMKGGGK